MGALHRHSVTLMPRSLSASLILIIVIGTLIRLPQLSHGLHEMHAFRQTHTAYVALEYARHGINLLHTPLPIFGPDTDMPLEFPFVQALAAVLIRLGIAPDSAVRVIGLCCFQVAAVLLVVLMLRWHNRRAALVAALLFEFLPFALAWGAASLVDFPSVACALGMVVGLDAWFRSGSRVGLVTGAVSAWLAFLVKATTPPAWCIMLLISAGIAYAAVRSWRRVAIGLLAGPALGLFLGSWWTWYADRIKDADPLTQFEKTSGHNDWNFGTVAQRLDPHAYAQIFVRVATEIAGPIGLGVLIAGFGLILCPAGPQRARRAGWLATSVFSPLVFFNLYVVHNYYLIAVFPAVVAAVALGIATVAERSLRNTRTVAATGTAAVIIGSAFSPNGLMDMHQWFTSPKNPREAAAIQAETAPDDLLIVVDCYDYDPEELYFADRRGLMLWRGTPANVWSYRDFGEYRYLFSCNVSNRQMPRLPYSHILPSKFSLAPTRVPGLWRIMRQPNDEHPVP